MDIKYLINKAIENLLKAELTWEKAKEFARLEIPVTFTFFGKEEYLIMKGNLIMFEDGVQILEEDWIKPHHKNGWYIHESVLPKIKSWNEKSEKWSLLEKKVVEIYCDPHTDLGDVGEATAIAFGFL